MLDQHLKLVLLCRTWWPGESDAQLCRVCRRSACRAETFCPWDASGRAAPCSCGCSSLGQFWVCGIARRELARAAASAEDHANPHVFRQGRGWSRHTATGCGRPRRTEEESRRPALSGHKHFKLPSAGVPATAGHQ